MTYWRNIAGPAIQDELQKIIERLVIVSAPKTTITSEQVGMLLNIDMNIANLSNKEVGLLEIVEEVGKRTIEKTLLVYGSTRRTAVV